MLRLPLFASRCATAFVVALIAVAMAFAPARAAAATALPDPLDELILWRGQGSPASSTLDFFVRGAQPGEQVFYAVTAADDEEAARLAAANAPPSIVADLEGFACLPVSRELAQSGVDRPFWVFAFVLRRDGDGAAGMVRSNFVLLRDAPALYLVVEVTDAVARAVQFDPLTDALEVRGAVDVDSPLVVAGASAIAELGGKLIRLDGRDSVRFGASEDVIDLTITPDQSALVALTRQRVDGGRELLRVRVADAANLARGLGLIDVLRFHSRLVNAQVVAGDDAHRVLVSESGVIREVMLGAELTRGVTFLPLAPDGSDELVDVRVVDDLLIAVTRARNAPESRLLVVDLRTRNDPIEWKLAARAERDGIAIATSLGRLAAFVVVEGGAIEVVPLDPQGTRATLGLAGARRIARSPHAGRLYVLALDAATATASVDLLDADALTLTPVALPPLSDQIGHFGLIGSSDRHWLYFIEQQFRARGGGLRTVHRLWSCPVEPETGFLVDPERVSPHLLGGSVRRVAGQ